jgi:phosphoglycolate phosphatase
MKPKLIVFDWDGTLADSVSKIIECKNFLAKKYALPVPKVETIKNVLGSNFEDALQKCFPTADLKTLKLLAEDFHILIQQDEYQAELFPQTKATLKKLKNKGFNLAIATSKAKKEFDKSIKHTHLHDFFNIVCCGDEYPGKPDPTMLYHIMEKCGVKSDQCVMVGDSIFDMQFAANANVKSIAVAFGACSAKRLESEKPLAIVDNWDQLLDAIDKL